MPTTTANQGMNSTIAWTPSVNRRPAVPNTTRKPAAIHQLTDRARLTDAALVTSALVPRKYER